MEIVSHSQTTRCVLPIVVQKDINAWLHQSLPLCILLTKKELHPWYYERYIQVYSQIRVPDELHPDTFRPATQDDRGREALWVDFFEEHIDHRVIFQKVPFDFAYMEREPDIIQFLQNAINQGYYPSIFLDNYFLPERSHYQKRHAITRALIYGYDTNKKKLLSVGFGTRSEFTSLEHDYSSFTDAYQSAMSSFSTKPDSTQLLDGIVELLKLRDFLGEYPFNIKSFSGSLENYLSGRVESGKNYFISGLWLRMPDGSWQSDALQDKIKFGYRVHDDLEQCLEMILDNRSIKPLHYPHVHFFLDHKQSIFKRIHYLQSIYPTAETLLEIQNGYKQVVNSFNAIRMAFLVYSTTGDTKNIRKILANIKSARTEELAVLTTLHSYLGELAAAEDTQRESILRG